MYGATIGRLGILGIPATVNQACCVFAEPLDTDIKFIYYYLQAAKEELLLSARGGGQPNLSQDDLRQLRLALPPLPTQRAIARYLDARTARIDALIARKQRLLELLAERRAALITRAVTRGLDPAAPTYDSGVDWLGDIPVGWEVKRLKYCVDLLPGYAFSSQNYVKDETQIPLLRGINIKPNGFDWEDAAYWDTENIRPYARYLLEEDDVVLGMDRPWITSGLRVLQIKHSDLPMLLLQRVARLRGSKMLDSSYLYYLLHSKPFLAYFTPIVTGVSVPHISSGQIYDFETAIPPIATQHSIVRKLKSLLDIQSKLFTETNTSIHHLQEYRSALITAAVNGEVELPQPE